MANVVPGVVTRSKSKLLKTQQSTQKPENAQVSKQEEEGIAVGSPTEREVIGHERSQIMLSPRSTRSKHSSSHRSRTSKASSSTSRRSIIEARKAAKRAEIQLEAAKKEAKLREKAIQLDNELKIQERRVELDIKRADLQIEEESMSGSSLASSDDCFQTLNEEIPEENENQDPKSWPQLKKSGLSAVPKETEKERVERYFASSPCRFQDSKIEPPVDVFNPSSSKQEQSALLLLGKEIAKQRKPFVKPFDGKVENFVQFKASIDRLTKTALYDDDEMLSIIQENVTGEAETAIKGILPGSGQFTKAMQILQNRFGNERAIIQANIASLRAHAVVQEKRADQLRSLSNVVCTMVQSFKSLNLEHDLKSSSIVQDAASKLPQSLFFKWHERVSDNPTHATLEHFNTWVERKAKHWEDAHISSTMSKSVTESKVSKSTSKVVPSQRRSVFTANTSPDKSSKCPVHDSSRHQLENCHSFKRMDSSQRSEVIYKHKLCYRCLHPGHMVKNCRQNVVCDVSGCSDKHHSLAHDVIKQRQSQSSSRSAPSENNPPSQVKSVPTDTPTSFTDTQPSVAVSSSTSKRALCAQSKSVYCSHARKQALLQILPVIIHGRDGVQHEVFAMLDSGCDCTLLLHQSAQTCGLIQDTNQYRDISVSGINGTQVAKSTAIEEPVYVSSVSNPYKKFALFDIQTIPQLPGPSQSVKWSEVKQRFTYLEDIDLPDVSGEQIALLIGSNNGRLLVPTEIIEPTPGPGSSQLPIALHTPLGWVATNCIPAELKEHKLSAFRTRVQTEADYDLKHLVESSMKVDALGITNHPSETRSKEEERAFKVMRSSTHKLANEDAYISQPLWKEKDPSLPNNYDAALRRLQSLEKRLEKDTQLKERYDQSIKEDIVKNYVRKLTEEESESPSAVKWYLPHHPVVNPRKPEKLRRVYDASAIFNGCSLNKALYKGPDLLPSLLGLLLRFCEKPYALAADIQEMYHQIRVPDCDKPAMRFLWRNNSSDEPEVYQFERMIFGEIDAPARANYVIQLNAEDHKDLFPLVAEKIPRWFYMDDAILSVDTVQEGIEVSTQLTKLLAKGGFRLHKWLSNSVDILQSIPQSERSTKVKSLTDGDLPVERTLGAYWNAQDDTFCFTSSDAEPGNTRRKILSQIFSIWDPRGQIAPFVIRAKVFLQKLWLENAESKKNEKLNWDDELSAEQLVEWKKWFEETRQLKNIALPRPLRSRSELPRRASLMIFCDASEKAYACCSYLLLEYNDDVKECNLITTKARVAPLKKLSIPRLELMGAVIGVRLAETLVAELETTIHRIIIWLDSAVALQWINRSSSRYHAFVGNRITEIDDALTRLREKLGDENVCLRYVPTKLNPADDATRGLAITKLTPESRWQKGPEFLTAPEESWPERRFEPVEDPKEELKQVKWVGMLWKDIDVKLFDTKKYSSLAKLQRIVAYCHRFIANCQASLINRNLGPLTVKELDYATRCLILRSQAESFPEEITALQDGKQVSTRSRLIKLDPKLENGMLVVGGRLNYAPLPRITKHPIILDSKHDLVRLLLSDYHQSFSHPSTNYLLYAIRRRYWIIGARNAIRKFTHSCVTCKKLRPKTVQPKMADLPPSRLTPGKFFDKVGIDFFGPLFVKRGRSEIKRYGCIFTCLKIRAIHVELAEDLSTDAFLLCLRNFIGRRGQPSELFSDNGTNFVGAESELRQGIQNLDQKKIENTLAPQMIQWHFNPPASPHMGGVWERMVQCVKRALYAVLKNRVVPQEVLRTTLIEIEALVNSRPIGYIPADAGDVEPLSPYHFLLIRPHLNVSFDVVLDKEIDSRKLWRRTQALTNMFWKRWVKEYVPTLTERSKWFKKAHDLKEGDVVLITDAQKNRGQWLMGRVEQVHQGKDGSVRSVDVKTQFGRLSRPTNKLCLLQEVL